MFFVSIQKIFIDLTYFHSYLRNSQIGRHSYVQMRYENKFHHFYRDLVYSYQLKYDKKLALASIEHFCNFAAFSLW